MSGVAQKLTDRIIAWMIEVEPHGKPQHFARDVVKAMGSSVGSAAQGLHLLYCRGLVHAARA